MGGRSKGGTRSPSESQSARGVIPIGWPVGFGPIEALSDPELNYVSYAIEQDRTRSITASVVIQYGSAEATGTAKGPATKYARLTLLAKATIDALMNLRRISKGKDVFLSLHGVKEVEAVGRCFVLVAVQAVQDRETKALVGTTQVEDSRDSAVIIATIQAADRWIRPLI